MRKKKRKKPKRRNWVAEMMTLTTRCKAFIDRRKEGFRKLCRQKTKEDFTR